MGGNYFNGTIPESLQSLKGLLVLNLSGNNLSSEIPKFLSSFKLEILDLSHNKFEGEVPTDGIFSNASGLSVRGNSRLCGGIQKLMLPHCTSSHNIRKTTLDHKKVLIIALVSGLFGGVLLLALFMLSYIMWQRRGKRKAAATSDDSEIFLNLSYQDLIRATNGFSSENVIGSGTFGVVYRGILDEVGSTTIAIKMFNLQNHSAFKSFMAECRVLRNIRHRNLLKVITVCSSVDHQGRDFKALVYEYMENGNLEDLLHPTEVNDRVEKLNIAVEIALAVDYLHNDSGRSPIIHCDLKPSNVLLDNDMVVQVGDFGLAKFLLKDISDDFPSYQTSSIRVLGTIGYAPPEYGVGNDVSTSGDVYSFGIILLEMFTGRKPTNDMFKGGLNLHSFVKEAVPGHVIDILDHVLVEEIEECDDSSLMLKSLTCTLEIALSCSTEFPHERPEMSNVAKKLSSIRNNLLGTRLQQRRGIQQH